jgi:hypothetical protein
VGKGLNGKYIHKEIFHPYSVKCLSCNAANNRVEKFSEAHSKFSDDARTGRPIQIATEATVQQVEELIQADRRIMIDSVATVLGCAHGLAYSIIIEHAKFWKVCARWMPKELKDREQMNRMGLSLQHFLRYADEGEDMLNRYVTGDESWVHHYQPETKHTSMQWEHPSSPSAKKFKVRPSAGKVVLSQKFGGKRPGKLARGLLIHHDIARPHTDRATQNIIQ